MSFEANRYPINTIMMNAIFQIPRNQRRYKWEEENWNDLFEDIIFSISAKKSHFIGSIVLEKNNEKNGLTYYKIIDGQQRLITITTALIAIMKLLYENEMDNDFWEQNPIYNPQTIEIMQLLILIQITTYHLKRLLIL